MDDGLVWCAEAIGPGCVVEGAWELEGATSSVVRAVDLRTPRGTLVELVLREYGERWLEEDPDAPAKEVTALRHAAAGAVGVPQVVATHDDPPRLLMTRLRGAPRADPPLNALAAIMRTIHALAPGALPAYAPYPLETRDPPGWTERPELWWRAMARFEQPLPRAPHTTIHRDFHPGNVLWVGDSVSGIVDWPMASAGPPAADVGHCRMDLNRTHGLAAADRFLTFCGMPDYDRRYDLYAVLGGFAAEDWVRADEDLVAAAMR